MELKRKLSRFWKSCINRDYRFFCQNPTPFDTKFFCQIGGFEEDAIDDLFWFYLKTERRLRSRIDFINDEWRLLPNPHALFDLFYYMAKYFPDGLKGNAYAHYLREGWKKDLWPGPFLDPDIYRQRSGWDKSSGNPLRHYARIGSPEVISPSLFFDIGYYLDKTSIYDQYKKLIIRQYRMYDAVHKKSPNPAFDPYFYLQTLKDEKFAIADPFSHYLTSTLRKNIRPNEWFDPAYYMDQVAGVSGVEEVLSHYLVKGVHEGIYTDPKIESFQLKPTISILVPVFNPEPHFLNCCIRSVLYQTYPHWELCLADDCSTDAGIKSLLQSWAAKDSRIKLTFHQENRGISETTNSAAKLAEGEYLGFLDNDDELTPDCLFHVVEAVNRTDARIVYTDEDLVGDDATRHSAFFKPDFNLNLLHSHNYITHFLVVERRLFAEVGGFDPSYDGAQDYDLILRLTGKSEQIVHIPRILYHWRALKSSTSVNHSQKPYAHEAGKKALQAAINVRGLSAKAVDTDLNFFYRTKYERTGDPFVSVVICSKNGENDEAFISRLKEQTEYNNCEFISIWQDLRNAAAETISSEVNDGFPVADTMTELVHKSAISCGGEFVAFVTDSVRDVESGWLEELVSPLLEFAYVGVTCGFRIREDLNEIYCSVPDISELSTEYFVRFLTTRSMHLNGLRSEQLVNCCGGDVCLVRKDLYHDLGGIDYKNFSYDIAIVDFTLKAGQGGWKILYSPFSRVILEENQNNDRSAAAIDDSVQKRTFQSRWKKWLTAGDPYYNLGILAENNIDLEKYLSWISGTSMEN